MGLCALPAFSLTDLTPPLYYPVIPIARCAAGRVLAIMALAASCTALSPAASVLAAGPAAPAVAPAASPAPMVAAAPPEEGMWLPLFIKRLNYEDMRRMGLRLTADELYSVNNSSLKDAVVHFGGFCTGEVISDRGLVLTNHHCGYDAIQGHSTVENNILRDGFWARTTGEEKPVPGLFVRFLERMESVTDRVLKELSDQMTETEREAAIRGIMAGIKSETEASLPQGEGLSAEVKNYFNGNEFYLLVYRTYTDVRLVGTPPEAIGKFGGDTDNWMWPRHTGDFSMFRIYANRDNKPAAYAAENVPYKPRHFFPVSMAGVKPGDFSMIFGYPGRTDRYLTSEGVKMGLDITAPAIVKVRDRKLSLMRTYMNRDPKVRIQYASKYARIANYWKYFQGEQQGLRRLNVVGKKQGEETEFARWVAADAGRRQRFGTVLTDLQQGYGRQRQFALAQTYFREAALGTDLMQLSMIARVLADSLAAPKPNMAFVNRVSEALKEQAQDMYKDNHDPLERELFAATMEMYARDIPQDQQPEYFRGQVKRYGGDFRRWADELYNRSALARLDSIEKIAARPTARLAQDPAVMLARSFNDEYQRLQKMAAPANDQLARANRLYTLGTMMRLEGQKKLYPNANSTMRMTYGAVQDYEARDAVRYGHLTTLAGVMEKEDTTNDEFIVPTKLKQLYERKDFGKYGEQGRLPVNFLTTNDITGGNSGSPVINARGELIGTAFDGNWEAMSGNIAFEPELQRTIVCDIRYVLFCIDKLGGASHLIDEMKLVYEPVPQGPARDGAPAAPAIKGRPGQRPAAAPARRPAGAARQGAASRP